MMFILNDIDVNHSHTAIGIFSRLNNDLKPP